MSCTNGDTDYEDSEYDKIHFIESCSHMVGKECIEQLFSRDYRSKNAIECPCGDSIITEFEIRTIVGDEQVDKMQHEMLMSAVDNDDSIVKCQGGNVMEIRKGKPDFNVKDEEGNVISEKAAKNMSKYRIRCAAGENNFCTKGKVQPYHLGKTCKEYKKYKNSVKCRFCAKVIKPRKKNDAFQNVGKDDECKDLK